MISYACATRLIFNFFLKENKAERDFGLQAQAMKPSDTSGALRWSPVQVLT